MILGKWGNGESDPIFHPKSKLYCPIHSENLGAKLTLSVHVIPLFETVCQLTI